jgi:hypothetical protein
LINSKAYHDQKASFDPKKAPPKKDFFEKITFPHIFGPVLLSTCSGKSIINDFQDLQKRFCSLFSDLSNLARMKFLTKLILLSIHDLCIEVGGTAKL